MRKEKIEKLVCRDKGKDEYTKYSSYQCSSIESLSAPIKKTLTRVPPSFGSCAMISAGLVSILEVEYSIPAIAVLGDLNIQGSSVFKCRDNLPLENQSNEALVQNWDGHCWVEVDSIICDLSIFRTAYRINKPSVLRSYILSTFGEGKGAFVSPIESLPQDIEFVPKFVLNKDQISGLLCGLSEQQRNSNQWGQTRLI